MNSATAPNTSPTEADLLADAAHWQSVAREAAPACDAWSLRLVAEDGEHLIVRQDIVQAPSLSRDLGAMITVSAGGGVAHRAVADLSPHGLRRAFRETADTAAALGRHMLFDARRVAAPGAGGRYRSPPGKPMPTDLAERLALVQAACARLHVDARIIDWSASLSQHRVHQVTVNSAGGLTDQQFRYMVPNASVTARDHGQTQTRTRGGQYNGLCRQGGLEVLEAAGFLDAATPLAQEAIALTAAPNCPEGRMDVLLMPDQMMLQIHESIGHPLELDRILGDERNFAGSSFVTLDMFGHYRYGSELLNVSFDPLDPAEFASFAFDDDGEPATKALLIENGLLLQPLGGSLSVARASQQQVALAPVATSRASGWNRAPIDRMSNLNIEPGSSSLADMIGSIERGVMMKTNCSWSIDDLRNKFQFGCEFGQMIRDGRLAEIVRNPNYRGQSASFWRSLRAVGNRDTVEALGTPFCGKGEPMQVIRVGHASPACLFGDVAVFGGADGQAS